MKRMLLIVPVLAILILSGYGNAEMEMEEFPELTVGDYFEFEFNMDQILQKALEDWEDYDSFEKIEMSMKMTVTGSEAVEVGEETHECWIFNTVMVMKYKLEGETQDDHLLIDMTMTSKEWVVKETFQYAKAEETTSTKFTMSMSYEGETSSFTSESETIEKTTYIKMANPEPLPKRVGLSWTAEEEFIVNTTEKSRNKMDDDPFDDWEFSYDESTENKQTNYEILSEGETSVPAGTFKTLKEKSIETGEEDYTINYYDESGMPVKMEEYEEGVLEFTISLKSYEIQNAGGEKKDDDEGFLPFFGVGAASLTLLGIASTGLMKKKRS